MPTATDWFLAIRPVTLTASLVPVLLTHQFLNAQGATPALSLTALAALSACCIQIGTNLFNDVVDSKRGADGVQRTGPKRLIASGLSSAAQVERVAHAFFLLAALFGIPLAWMGGWPILALGLASIVCGYGYTAPPLQLAYRGWSEPFVILFFGILATCGVYWIHVLRFSPSVATLGMVLGLLATNLLVVNNIRDMNSDRAVGKLTLAARFGLLFSLFELSISLALGIFLSVGLAHNLGLEVAPLLLCFIPAIVALVLVARKPQARIALPLCAISHLAFGVVLAQQLTSQW